jgi:hypothetical protein
LLQAQRVCVEAKNALEAATDRIAGKRPRESC